MYLENQTKSSFPLKNNFKPSKKTTKTNIFLFIWTRRKFHGNNTNIILSNKQPGSVESLFEIILQVCTKPCFSFKFKVQRHGYSKKQKKTFHMLPVEVNVLRWRKHCLFIFLKTTHFLIGNSDDRFFHTWSLEKLFSLSSHYIILFF